MGLTEEAGIGADPVSQYRGGLQTVCGSRLCGAALHAAPRPGHEGYVRRLHLCTCTVRVKPPISVQCSPSYPSEVLDSLESQSDPPDLPPDTPREPILTLPGALTAYVALLAVVHLRVLLPPDLESWTIDVFGFIPRRYDPTL